jgi:hypothetical protein
MNWAWVRPGDVEVCALAVSRASSDSHSPFRSGAASCKESGTPASQTETRLKTPLHGRHERKICNSIANHDFVFDFDDNFCLRNSYSLEKSLRRKARIESRTGHGLLNRVELLL